MNFRRFAFTVSAALACASLDAFAYDAPVEGDFTISNFRFDGETLPSLSLHYRTLGKLKKDRKGHATNAVLILHGTGGAGTQFLTDQFAKVLYEPGQVLDTTKYFIVLPDGIGHGKSSRPSAGLRGKFPHYGYGDMVRAQYRLLTEKLGVDHARLVMGTSMGGMQSWVWGETYPDFMDALMPLASAPVQIAGRNRMMRDMIAESIRLDPQWNGGDYTQQPGGLRGALNVLMIMSSVPLQWQKSAPDRESADTFYHGWMKERLEKTDANDLLYQIEASRDYDPAAKLESIKAPLLAINSADDQINPPELGILEREIKRVPHGRAVVIPISEQTHGHSTHTWAAVWQDELARLLKETEKPAAK